MADSPSPICTLARLEDHPEEVGLPALERFDTRLANAVSGLSSSTTWAGLVSAGGSTRDVLARHNSQTGLPPPGILATSNGSADRSQGAGPLLPPAWHAPLDDQPVSSLWEGMVAAWPVVLVSRPQSLCASAQTHAAPCTADGGPPAGDGAGVLAQHTLDFWTNICLCHSLIIEEREGADQHAFQGPSPDEVALVTAARQMGYEFKGRHQSKITLSMLGVEASYEILNMNEYSSDRWVGDSPCRCGASRMGPRSQLGVLFPAGHTAMHSSGPLILSRTVARRGCMSVVTRTPDGTIRVYCKGSDAKILKKVRTDTDPSLVAATEANLHDFAIRVRFQKLLPQGDWGRSQPVVGALPLPPRAVNATVAFTPCGAAGPAYPGAGYPDPGGGRV